MRDTGRLHNLISVIVAAILLLVGVSGCGNEVSGDVGPSKATGAGEQAMVDGMSEGFEITDEDRRTTPSADAAKVDLSKLQESFAIDEGGDYVLSGNTSGRITIDSKEQPVHLFLNGVSIETENGGAILVTSASKVIITCLQCTENVICDSAYYGDQKDYDACIYSFSDLTFNGAGTLRVKGLYEDAIHSKDILKVVGTDLEVQAKGDGLKGNDGVCLLNTKAKVETEKNGIRTNKNGHEIKGSVEIRDSEMSVIAGRYSIESYDLLAVSGSRLYLNGILGNWQVAGDVFVEEGNLVNG